MCHPNTSGPAKRGFDVDVWLDGGNGSLCAQRREPSRSMVLWTSIHVVAATKDEAEKEAATQFYRGLVMKVRAKVQS